MPFQVIPQSYPCGKPAKLRLLNLDSLGSPINIGDSFSEGNVADGVDIESGVVYVVTGGANRSSPGFTTGTISYAGDDYNVGQKITGTSGNTSFTRSVPEIKLLRTSGSAISATAVTDGYYVVSGGDDDSVVYPTGSGNTYRAGDVFKADAGTSFSMTTTGSPEVFRITDTNRIDILARHNIGAHPIPGVVDYSASLGTNPSQGAVIPADFLNRVYIWNFGTSAARVIFRAYNSTLDTETGATRMDVAPNLLSDQEPYIWFPTTSFRQGAEGSGLVAGDRSSNANFDEDTANIQNAFLIQTNATGIWVKPEHDELFSTASQQDQIPSELQ